MYMADTSLSTLTPLMENGAFTAFSAAELGERAMENNADMLSRLTRLRFERYPAGSPCGKGAHTSGL